MNQMPNSIPTSNNHRIALLFPEHTPSDFERLEDLAADAIRAGRSAMQAAQDLPQFEDRALNRSLQIIGKNISARRVVNEDFQNAVEDTLRRLAHIDRDKQDAIAFSNLLHSLAKALELSHRVADLLSAEQDIGWNRGIGPKRCAQKQSVK